MRRYYSYVWLTAALSILLAACGGSNSSPQNSPNNIASPPPANAAPAGGAISNRSTTTYDQILESNIDSERIAFTVHEPDTVTAGQSYPLVLHSHGYSGRRQQTRPTNGLMGQLLANGYGIISIDERGHGANTDGSGGTIRILDPNFEGLDLLQMLDWADANLDWMMVRNGNAVVGAIGGSYGGGYQHLIYRLDPQKRLDAITPDITWYDLRYSLFSNDVFKTFWASALSGVGNNPQHRTDPQVNQGLAQGLLTNSLGQTELDLLYNNSIASNCNGDRPQDPPLTPIPALYSQSVIDTLFNFTETYRNVECLSALGGDVRVFMKPNGHSGGNGQHCGSIELTDARIAWFDEYLKLNTGAANFIPQVCYQLVNNDANSTDAVAVNAIQYSNTDPNPITVATAAHPASDAIIALNGSPQIVNLDLTTISDANGDILAGIPTIVLDMSDPSGINTTGDPIIFVGLGRSTDGGNNYTLIHDQITPFRGFGQHAVDLVGVIERLNQGDIVSLMVHASHAGQYASSGTPAAGTPPAGVPVNITADVRLPLIGTAHPTP